MRRGAFGSLAAAAVLIALPACSTGQGDDATPSSTPTISTPTPTVTTSPTPDPSSDAANAALATYRSYWDAVVKARSVPDPESAALLKYGGDTALANEQSSLLYLQRQGIVFKGKPALEPKVTDVALEPTPVVTIEDCVDSTDWEPIVKETGKSAEAPGQSPRIPSSSSVAFVTDRWLVLSIESDRSRTC